MSMTDDDDTTQAQPMIPDDDASDTSPAPAQEAAPAAQEDQPAAPQPAQGDQGDQGDQNQSGFVPGGAPGLGQQINGGIKKIVSYLQGAGAAQPQVAQKFEQGIKAENPGISDDDANLLAVHKAQEMGGPGAAWAMLQYNRMSFNAKQAFAKAALNGVDGKTGNAQAAALAATQAGAHILDGSATTFTAQPGGQGFTATVKIPGTNRSIGVPLTSQQMDKWLDVGGAGQWDKIMETGTPAALQKISSDKGDPSQQGAPPQGEGSPPEKEDNFMGAVKDAREDNQDSDPQEPEANPNAGQPTNFGTTPSTLNLSGSNTQPSTLPPKPYSYGNDLEAQSRAMFPNISDEAKRQQFMATQQNQRSDRINKLGVGAMGAVAKQNVAQTRADAGQTMATTRAGGQVGAAEARASGQRDSATIRSNKDQEIAKQKANAVLQQAQMRSRDNATRNRIAQARLEINDPNALMRGGQTVDPQDILKKYGLGSGPAAPSAAPVQGQPPAPAAQPQAAPSAAANNSVPPIAGRIAGKTTVTTAKGTFVWNGQGWGKQ
jgi:hypothetical protein